MYQDQNQPDTEKRLLLALLLSTAVLLISPTILNYFFPPTPQPAVVETTPPAVTEPEPPGPSPVVPSAQLPVERSVGEEGTQATPQVFTIQNEDVLVRLSNQGVVLESVQLRKYFSEGKEPLELIPQGLPPERMLPLAIRVTDESLNDELERAVFEPVRLSGTMVRGPAELLFSYRSSRLDVTRRIVVPESGYVLEVETSVVADGRDVPYSVYLGPGIGNEGTEAPRGFLAGTGTDFEFPAIAYSQEGAVQRYDAGDVEEPLTVELAARWVAYDSRFFSYLILAPGSIQSIGLRQQSWNGLEAEGVELPSTAVAQVGLAASATCSVFVGPKDLEILGAVDPSLRPLVDFGWFAVLVKPLLFCLQVAYGVVNNYGWAIIIVTFFINLILLPIRYKQTKSMKKMSEVQPQLKAIQNKYKKLPRKDPKRQDMNKEIMELYQQHGVNPLGGCLPLLVQMPFLFAFYRMLASSIELRGAPFMLWIQDLSKADPYYITPIVMGATMIVQQKMTPATGDPAQRRMMMIMPVVFMFFFLSLSSGLVIYFLFSNVFGMLFQWAMQKMSPSEEVKPSSKPKRDSKKGKKA